MLVFNFGSPLHTGRIDQLDEKPIDCLLKYLCRNAGSQRLKHEATLTSCHNEAQRSAGHSLQHAPSFV